MTEPFTIAILVGSLRAGSFSSRVADAFAEVAGDRLRCQTVPIGDLPFYNQDHEGDAAPAAYAPFREVIAAADAVLFVTPEYNRGVPAALKNAIDVGSRPRDDAVLAGKPAAIISQSPGPLGGFGANHALRQSLVPLDLAVVQQPECYFGQIAKALDDDGRLVNPHYRDLLFKLVAALETLIRRSVSEG